MPTAMRPTSLATGLPMLNEITCEHSANVIVLYVYVYTLEAFVKQHDGWQMTVFMHFVLFDFDVG